MSEPKFTKGPWTFGRGDDGRGVIFINRGIGNHIAYLSNGGVPEEQEEANGHLIAAAPQMYEALSNLVADLGIAWEDDPLVQTAKDALSSATGEA